MEEGLNFDLPKNRSSVIKVIGVGGGGSNAVNHMKRLGINGVDFVVCNTDAQALEHSPVENKIQLGANLTEGLGAGANPEVGERAALETVQEIEDVLGNHTKMLFITAGMGGGTGTGAAPVIARTAQDLGILTVGIVTIPFAFEGKIRLQQAKEGIEKFKQNLDSLIVINNNKLREVYGNLGFKAGFAKADEVLATAAKGIAEVITHHYTANIDLKDAKTVLANSGTAIMGSAKAKGQNRAMEAIRGALDSPLLNDNHIVGAKNVLLLIVCGSDEHEITFDEIGEVNDFIQSEAGGDANIIMGIGQDEELGEAVSITIIATGFSAQSTVQPFTRAPERVVHVLDGQVETDKPLNEATPKKTVEPEIEDEKPHNIQRGLFDVEEPAPTSDPIETPIPQGEAVPEVIGENVREEADVSHEDSSSEEPVAETPAVEENAPSSEIEERVVFDLGEFDLDSTNEFVIEDEAEEEVVVEEQETAAQAEEAEDRTNVFDFSIEDVFEEEGTVEPSSQDTPNMEWEVDRSAIAESSEEDTNDPIAESTSTSDVELEEVSADEPHYEEVRFSLDDDIADETPKALEEPVTQSHQPENDDRIVHTLEDLRELESKLGLNASPENAESKKEPEVEETLQFEVKTAEIESKSDAPEMEADPLDRPIEETMRKRNEGRSKRLRQFNYKFKNVQGNILDNEKEPAYKRQGLELNQSKLSEQSQLGNTSIGGDGDDLEFRSNNSFLHDNVD